MMLEEASLLGHDSSEEDEGLGLGRSHTRPPSGKLLLRRPVVKAYARISAERVLLTRKQSMVLALVVVGCVGVLAVGLGVGLSAAPAELQAEAQKKVVKPGLFESWEPVDSGGERVLLSTEPPPSPTELGEYSTAAVSADGIPCAQIAVDVLRQNGSAADAAVAGLFCVGVINTQSMGLGGGFLMTYYDRANGKAYTLNAREAAPLAAYEDMYNGNGDLMVKGGLAVGVPGELRGYRALYDRFGGKVPWEDLIEPTIQLCENGHLVNWHMARALSQNREAILNEPSMSVFVDPNTGDVYKEGDILKRPQLAETLRVLQAAPDALYTGQLADKLIEDLQTFNSIITLQDLQTYQPVWRDALNVSLENGGLHMFSVPTPGSGAILAFILNILDEYNFTPESLSEENKVVTHQRITEAFKWAYAKRTELGDDNCADCPDMTELLKNLTSETYAESIQGQITDNLTFQDPEHYGAVTAQRDNHGTAHFSLLGPNGDAVSVTSTINLYFGAGIRSVQTGIVLNDEMDDFSAPNVTNYFGIPPSPANFISPGKRPLSSMCPAVFVDDSGDVRLVTGAAGGTKISSAVAWASLRNLWLGDNIKEAVDARRIHHQLFPMELAYEEGIQEELVTGLENIGHVTSQFGVGGSVICAIARQNNTIYANSDFRKAGEVDGF